MKKKVVILTILILLIIILSGCGPKCPECDAPGVWSACDDNAIKTRTSYECSEETQYQCQSVEQTENCRTEVTAKGRVGDSMIRITPSIEKEVKGIITIEYVKVPEGTNAVAFAISEGSLDFKENGINLPIDSDGSDGFSILLDTSKYENGLYEVGAVAAKNFENGVPPLDAATAQIVIKN